MNRTQALEYVKEYYSIDLDKQDNDDFYKNYCALLEIRHCCDFLPRISSNLDTYRDESEWAFIDMCAKNDSGHYGRIHYFGDSGKVLTDLEKDRILNEIFCPILNHPLLFFLSLYAPAPVNAPNDWYHHAYQNMEAWKDFVVDTNNFGFMTYPIDNEGEAIFNVNNDKTAKHND